MDKEGCFFVVFILIALVISTVVYLGGGWLLKDIWNSIDPLTDAATFEDIYLRQIKQYNILCGAFCLILSVIEIGMDFEEIVNDYWTIFSLIIPIGSYMVISILPPSEGAAILNTVICIIMMTVYLTHVFGADFFD